MIGEAIVVGVVASAIGLLAGVGIARLLDSVFTAIGADLPDYPTILATRTVVLAVALGIGVTIASSIAPARAAASVSPMAALRDGGAVAAGESRRRLLTGGLTMTAGIGLGLIAAAVVLAIVFIA